MNFIWFSVLLISFGGILNFFNRKKRNMKKQYLIITYIILIFIFSVFYLSLDKKTIYNTEDLIGKKINEVELNLLIKGTFNTKEISNYNYTDKFLGILVWTLQKRA